MLLSGDFDSYFDDEAVVVEALGLPSVSTGTGATGLALMAVASVFFKMIDEIISLRCHVS
jgi:hypothetical protein